jgi:hypothetical protein
MFRPNINVGTSEQDVERQSDSHGNYYTRMHVKRVLRPYLRRSFTDHSFWFAAGFDWSSRWEEESLPSKVMVWLV